MPERVKKIENKINILFNFINYRHERVRKIKTCFYFINSILLIISGPRTKVGLFNKIKICYFINCDFINRYPAMQPRSLASLSLEFSLYSAPKPWLFLCMFLCILLKRTLVSLCISFVFCSNHSFPFVFPFVL